jgi:hypothetical protein
MPIHDWTKVNAGTFHDFHQTWIVEIKRALNAGCLPAGFYAMAEQIAGGLGPDVLTLEGPASGDSSNEHEYLEQNDTGRVAIAVAQKPPSVRHHAKVEMDAYAAKASAITIRHASNHRVVAMIEIVSPGNKNSRNAFGKFVAKAIEVLEGGVHLLIVDLFPPGRLDPLGLHAAIWQQYTGEPFTPPAGVPLTLASYIGGDAFEAYVEPTAVGQAMIDMPLFLEPDAYVAAPLESTYQLAWEAVPAVWRRVLESRPNP